MAHRPGRPRVRAISATSSRRFRASRRRWSAFALPLRLLGRRTATPTGCIGVALLPCVWVAARWQPRLRRSSSAPVPRSTSGFPLVHRGSRPLSLRLLHAARPTWPAVRLRRPAAGARPGNAALRGPQAAAPRRAAAGPALILVVVGNALASPISPMRPAPMIARRPEGRRRLRAPAELDDPRDERSPGRTRGRVWASSTTCASIVESAGADVVAVTSSRRGRSANAALDPGSSRAPRAELAVVARLDRRRWHPHPRPAVGGPAAAPRRGAALHRLAPGTQGVFDRASPVSRLLLLARCCSSLAASSGSAAGSGVLPPDPRRPGRQDVHDGQVPLDVRRRRRAAGRARRAERERRRPAVQDARRPTGHSRSAGCCGGTRSTSCPS